MKHRCDLCFQMERFAAADDFHVQRLADLSSGRGALELFCMDGAAKASTTGLGGRQRQRQRRQRAGRGRGTGSLTKSEHLVVEDLLQMRENCNQPEENEEEYDFYSMCNSDFKNSLKQSQ